MANLILDNLYLGDWKDGLYAKNRGQRTLCVIETLEPDRYAHMDYYVPILAHDEYSLAISPPLAIISKLDEACRIITKHLEAKEDLLVHCYAGMERSPLTLAYWLVKTDRQETLAEAYKFLKGIRPIVEDRSSWLPPGKRHILN